MRPPFAALCLFALAFGACSPKVPEPAGPPSAPEAQIAQGALRGAWAEEDRSIALFAGIPYAAPPIGERRWAPPAPAAPWEGVREAGKAGARCMQPDDGQGGFVRRVVLSQGLVEPALGQTLDRLAGLQGTPMSEDCLFLNVRTRAGADGAALPVMVWIHGGSHQTGSGADPRLSGNALVKNGVVLVTVNYRLNAFGYLSHPALTAESATGVSGNYGLQDLIAALGWVQENIRAFGGDPDNVTIFGESAGGQSVSQLMSSPLARGLFDKVILQSGVYSYDFRRIDDSRGDTFIREAGLVKGSADVSALRSIPAEAILKALAETPPPGGNFMPGADGVVLPMPVGRAIAEGAYAQTPVLAGYNADEGTLLYPTIGGPSVDVPQSPEDRASRLAAFRAAYGDVADPLIRLYGLDHPTEWRAAEATMLGDSLFGVHTRFLGKASAVRRQPAFLYFFSRRPPAEGQTAGAFHSAEIPFVFGTDDWLLEMSEADAELSRLMGLYWTNFARTGNPNGQGLPAWPGYGESDQWMILDHSLRVEAGVRRDRLDLLERHLTGRIEASAGASR